jgi:hypothetical protein
MTPVTQTIVANQIPGVRGNCIQACVASILDLPIDKVPHFGMIADAKSRLSAIDGFLNKYGYRLVGFAPASEINNPTLARGVNGYVIASGISPRNRAHVVIYKNGKMVHDVHPARKGLTKLNGFYVIEPIMKESGFIFS